MLPTAARADRPVAEAARLRGSRWGNPPAKPACEAEKFSKENFYHEEVLTDSQITEALKRVEAGLAVPELCREMGVSTATFYKWRSKFGGMDASMARMKELEEETADSARCTSKKSSRPKWSRRHSQKSGEAISPPRWLSKPWRTRWASIRYMSAFLDQPGCYRHEAGDQAENDEIADCCYA